jgi:hypothetical protein
MHPLAGDFSNLKDNEIHDKITDLTNKYFMTRNPGVQAQISSLLEAYKEESSRRQRLTMEKMMANRDKGLDKLINIS